MEKKLRSIVEEILDYTPPQQNRDLFVESRAQQVIASARHLLKLINESYDAETANDLSRRLQRAIATGDQEKFCRKMRAMREARGKREPLG